MAKELEAVVFCPKCLVDKFSVFRVKTENENVFVHVTEPPNAAAKKCECGTQLERR